MRHIMRALRSRTLALGLILGVSVYMGAVTVVPQVALYPVDHAEWAARGGAFVEAARWVGLDRAYSNAIFFVLCLLLTLTTAVCAWERSVRAVRVWRGRGRVSAATRAKLEDGRATRVSTVATVDVASARVESNLRRAGYRIRQGGSLRYAEKTTWGLAGSPLFHWGLVAVVLVVWAGSLTRWEGALGVPEGGSVEESAASYRTLDRGPLSLPHTGWALRVAEIDEDMELGGVYYGVTPRISVSDGNRVLSEQLVYPNHPLRHGPLLIHLMDYGLNVSVTVTDGAGRVTGQSDRLIDFDETAPSGTAPSVFGVVDEGGSEIASVTVLVNARDSRGVLPRLVPPGRVVQVTVRPDSGETSTAVLAAGESVALPDGYTLRVSDLGYYARLSVVRDWSASLIFVLLGMLTLFLGVAVLAPYRHVWIRFVETDDGVTDVYVSAVSYRRDPVYARTVLRIVSEGLDPIESGE